MIHSAKETAERCRDAGAVKASLTTGRMLLRAVFAGMFIALGAYGSQVITGGVADAGLARFLGAIVFSVGLLMVVMTGAELFTGNCLLVVAALDRRISWGKLLQNWCIVYIGNLIGSLFTAAVLVYGHSYSLYGGTLAGSVVQAAAGKVALSVPEALLRAVMCNVLVCVAVWIAYAVEDAAGKVLGVCLPILLFVVSGYEHCVANMYFIPAGMLAAREYGIAAEGLGIGAFLLRNLLPVTIGNILGGGGIVGAGLYLCHLAESKKSKE